MRLRDGSTHKHHPVSDCCDSTIDPIGIVHSLRVSRDAWDLQSRNISLFTSVITEKVSAQTMSRIYALLTL